MRPTNMPRACVTGGLLLSASFFSVGFADNIVWNGAINSFWHESGNWFGGVVPVDGDVAWVSSGGVALLNANTAWIDGLRVGGGGRVDTDGFRLGVDESFSAVTSITGTNSTLVVRKYAADPRDRAFDTDLLTVANEGTLQILGAIAQIDEEAVFSETARLRGYGEVQFGTPSTTVGTAVLVNDGSIQGQVGLDPADVLTLTAYGGGTLDLDGAGEAGLLLMDDNPDFGGDRSVGLVVDGPLADEFSGSIQIGAHDSVTFQDPWTARDATIQFNPHEGVATLGGAPWICYDSTVEVVHGAEDSAVSVIDGDVHFGDSAVIVRGALRLNGATVFSSDSQLILLYRSVIDVNDSLTLYGDVYFNEIVDLNGATELNIYGETTINQTVVDLDSDGGMVVRVGSAGVLTLNVDDIDDDVPAAFNRRMEIEGVLNANVTGGWIADGDVQLMGGLLTGTTLTNDGALEGYGTITAEVVNNGAITASGGTLTLNSAGDGADLDGTTGAGVLQALAGNLTLLEGDVHAFRGELYVGPTRTLRVEGSLELGAPGTLYLNGGRLETGGDLQLDGSLLMLASPAQIHVGRDLRMDGASTILAALEVHAQEDVFLDAGSSVVLNSELRVFSEGGSSYIQAGANVTGTGTFVVHASEQTVLLDGAELSVHVRNEGSLKLGAGVSGEQANARVDSLQQTPQGSLDLTFAATGKGEFDQVLVTGAAQIDGALSFSRSPISILPPEFYDPQIGDSWIVLKAGSVVGRFDEFEFDPAIFPRGSYVFLDYQPQQVVVQILRGLGADFDRDGDVDEADLDIWQSSYGANDHADATGDGRSNGADLLAWQRQQGRSIATAVAGAAVPEPGTQCLLLLLLLTAVILYRSCLRERYRGARGMTNLCMRPHGGATCP